MKTHLPPSRGILHFLLLGVVLVPLARSETEPASRETHATSAELQVATADKPVVVLQPYVVDEIPPGLSFGLSLSLWKGDADLISALYISKVKPGSDAEIDELGPRTRIYAIDGVPVESLKAGFKNGSELHRIFVNRKRGDKVTLEVVPAGSNQSKTVTLMERKGIEVRFGWKEVKKSAAN